MFWLFNAKPIGWMKEMAQMEKGAEFPDIRKF